MSVFIIFGYICNDSYFVKDEGRKSTSYNSHVVVKLLWLSYLNETLPG